MAYSQSHFLRDSSNSNAPRLTVTVPPPSVVSVARSGTSETGNVSPTIRRWQATFQLIRQDRHLISKFLRRLQTRGDFFGPYFLLRFEDTVRRVVRQGLDQMVASFNLPPRLLPDQSTRYCLRFINSMKSPTYTTEKVEPIQVAIYDSYTKKVSTDCPFSSAKVRFTVLDAEFCKNKGETWSRREFNDSILSDRVGKFPILTCGGRTFQLKDGVGAFEEIRFGDNSSWTKSGFCLGVMVEVEREENGERVQEAVSNSFRVLDRRGKASQKPNQLKLEHKVQNLKKIGKDLASRLESNNIDTVEDFVSLYYRDRSELRKILGIKSETDKRWKNMVNHALECANEFHAKYEALGSTSQPQLVSTDKEVNIVNRNTNQIYCEYPIDNNMNFVSPLEADLHERTPHHLVTSSELLVHSSGSNGLCFVGSGSSEANPFESCSINPGSGQLEIPSESVSMEVLLENVESCLAEYEGLGNTCMPQQCMAIQTGSMLNVYSMQQTNAGSPQLSTDMDPMEYLNADAEFDPIWQVPLISLPRSVDVGPLSPQRKAKRKALLKWITWPAVARKRARNNTSFYPNSGACYVS